MAKGFLGSLFDAFFSNGNDQSDNIDGHKPYCSRELNRSCERCGKPLCDCQAQWCYYCGKIICSGCGVVKFHQSTHEENRGEGFICVVHGNEGDWTDP